MKTLLRTLFLLLALTSLLSAQEHLIAAERAVQGKQFTQAIKHLDEHRAAANAKRQDYATYLKALALYHDKQDQGTIATCDDLTKKWPNSKWARKALFLKSRTLVRMKRFEDAEKIYEDEANRLFSPERKKEIAGVLVEFGDELSRKPKDNELDALPPDYKKALHLYNKALSLEIGRELRDEVFFKVARCHQHLRDWNGAEKQYRAYLAEFDPKWAGPVGSPERFRGQTRENPLSAGAHWKDARFHLVEVQLSQCGQTVTVIKGLRHQALQVQQNATPHLGKLQVARLNAEDLLGLLDADDPALKSDTHWLLVRSYNLPHPASNERGSGLQAARKFLAAHPTHPRATDTSRLIALTYHFAGQTDNAIAAYGDFAKASNFKFVPEDGEIDPRIRTGKSCSATLSKWTQEAVFRIGELRFQQKKYKEAVQQWKEYIARFPNGAQWSQCQGGIINAQFQIGIDAVAAKDYALAKGYFDEFLKDYPLDGRARQILFTLGQIQYAQAGALKEENEKPNQELEDKIADLYRKAIAEWERLVSKYPNTEESSLALYRIGVIQEEKLGKLDQALATYQRLTWGSSAGKARQRFDTMTKHSLAISTARTYRTDEPAVIEVTSRNAPKLTFKQYFLNLEAYFRKTHGIRSIEQLDVDLIEPDKTWVVEVKDYAKYKPITELIEIPFEEGKPGVCVIKVSEEDFEATTLVIRSDIDIITKTSRRELLVFAQNRRTNKPAAGVSIFASDGKEVFGTGTTGQDGVFRQDFFKTLKESPGVHVFASSEAGIASNSTSLEHLAFSSGLSPRGYIYTEKPTYRPGETVNIRGILRDVIEGSYAIPKGRTFAVRVLDPKGRMLKEIKRKLSKFGVFDSKIRIDSGAPLGAYTISVTEVDAKSAPTFSGTFQVQRYKLEKVELAFEFPRKVYFRGESIAARIKASYYWGTPAAGESIEYILPDGRKYEGRTDENGIIEITFDPSGFLPGRTLAFQALAKAYNVGAQDSVMLAALGFQVSLSPSAPVALAGEPVDIKVETKAADGKPIGKELTVFVLRREVPKPDKILTAVPWIQRPTKPAGEVTVEEHKVTTDAETGLATLQLKLAKGGHYILRASGEDRFQQVVTGESRIRISDDEDSVKLRFFAQSDTGQVGSVLPLRLHSRLKESLALLTFEGETILTHEVITLKPGFNPVALKLDHKHFPNFRIAVASMDGTTVRSAAKHFTVERELRVKVTPRKDVEAPGAEGVVDLEVTDQNGKPVEAALTVALVNEALYALYPEAVAPIKAFFQSSARRNAEFRLGTTCGFAYVGVTRPVVKSIAEEKQRLAERAKEVEKLAAFRLQNRYADFSVPARDNIGGGGGFANLSDLNKDGLPDLVQQAGARQLGRAVHAQEPSPDAAPDPFLSRAALQQQLEGQGQAVGGKKQSAAPRKEVMNASRWISAIVTDAQGKASVTIPLPESTTKWRLTSRGCTVDSLVGQATASLITRKDFFLELKTPVITQEGDTMEFLAKVHNLTGFEGAVTVKLQIKGGKGFKDQQIVQVKPNSVSEVVFETFPVPLADSIRLTANAAAGKAADTLVVKLPVRPWGLEFSSAAGGISSASASGVLKLPEGQKYTRQRIDVTISPSVQQALIDFALTAGSQATQANDLLAAVSALNYATSHDGREEEIRVLRERVRTLCGSLTSTQHDDGRWAWHNNADLFVTSRTYWALALARNAGVVLHPDVLSKAEKVLTAGFSKLGTQDNDSKAVVLHALSITGKADFAHLNRIYRERAGLTSNALAHAAVAMVNLGRTEFARDFVALLEKKAKQEAPANQPKIAWWVGEGHTWLQDTNETTAMTLLALAGTNPDSPLAEQAANMLLRNKGCFRYSSPKAIGPAVAALAAYYEKAKHEKSDFEVTVLVNNEAVGTFKSSEIGRSKSIEVPAKLIAEGANTVRFEKKGPGAYHYAATLTAFSPDLKNPNSWGDRLHFTGGGFYHANLSYRGVTLKNTSTSPVTQVEVGQRIRVTSNTQNYSSSRNEFRIRIEHLPAGMLLVDGSLKGDFQHHEVGDGKITLFYSPGKYVGSISYELVAYAPGTFRVLPSVIRDYYNRHRMTLGVAREITVLEPGKKSEDPYKMNRHERFELATLNFNDGNYEQALAFLLDLFENQRKYYERDLARMLLWIYTMDDYLDEKRVVEMFEILRERHPDLTIPFDKILVVGKAYRLIGEHERAWLVFRATIDSSFINDASISATLEDQGQFLGSLEYQEKIWRDYPDSAPVVGSFFAISQQLYQKAPKAAEIAKEELRRKRARGEKVAEGDALTRFDLLKRSVRYLNEFLTLYPDDPLADDAAFSMANAFFALKDYKTVVQSAEGFQQRYPKSEFVSSFRYMAALGHFWQLHYEKALAAAGPVTEGESKDRDYARYITAQIHHAQGTPGEAIAWYEKVKNLYPDAKEAIEYFEEEKISLDEVTTFKPGEKVEVDLRYRNIKEAFLQIYKVDLMKLYLREKNLTNITKVHLAGIEPESELTIKLGDGKDYRDRETKAVLPLKEEGAYLVICRGDNLFTSGMVLVTPLKLEIQETPSAGALRVNVRDTAKEGYRANVHVKAIGSSDSEFKSGESDLRGVFVAEGLNGTATVIARQDGHYAFYRGTTPLGNPPQQPNANPQARKPHAQQLKQGDYLRNLDLGNDLIQKGNIDNWNRLRRGKGGKGVEVKKAY